MRIHTIDALPQKGTDEVSMRVDNALNITDIISKLIDWCLSHGVKKVKLNDITGVKMARKMSGDRLDVQYDIDEPAWNMENGVNYII